MPDISYYYLHPDSEFDAKFSAHENKHVDQLQTLMDDVINIAYTGKVAALTGDTSNDVIASIVDVAASVYIDFITKFAQQIDQFEKEAYAISNPMPPVYFNNHEYD